MPALTFVMSPSQSWPMGELVETLRYELDRQALPSVVHTDGFPAPQPETVYVLVAPHEYLALEGEQALPDDAILKRTIFLCAQPPNTLVVEEEPSLLHRAGAVFDINHRSVAVLRQAGIPARHLRPGYSELRDHFDPEAERPIDVMFLGAADLRRFRQLNRCARVLARQNCLLQISDDVHPDPCGSSSFIAEGKWDLLARTNVLLNLHRGGQPHFEWLRALDAIHTGAVVVSEHSVGIAPLVPGEHLLLASPESLPFVLESALRDGERLRRLRTQAHEQIRSWLPFALSVSVFRAAAVELVGRPSPPTASLGQVPAARTDGWSPRRQGRLAQLNAIRHELHEMRVDATELRREIARLERLVSDTASPRPVELVHETSAWPARHAPRVTVVTAVHNQAEELAPSLDSLASSWLRDFELVVVDDGSTDGSREAAREWMRRHRRVAARLVGHTINRGMGAARNTALDFARAPYSLIFDLGGQLYPRCLEVLAWTLDGTPDAAFAYPMVEVMAPVDALAASGSDYLLNVFGWEPRRLTLGERPDSLAMVRTECLRELGGFSSDPHLYGWEDFDFWCRVAEQGRRGQLVSQILGRRRAFPTSLARRMDFSDPAVLRPLVERAPRLLSDVASSATASSAA